MFPHILLRVRSFHWGGNVRTLTEADGTILFCGKDIATALGFSKPFDAIARHCAHSMKRGVTSKRANQYGVVEGETEMTFISEGDVIRLILRSTLPSAQKFEREFVGLGIFINNDRPVVSSRDIARVFEKEHFVVLKAIRELKCPESFTDNNFIVSEYEDNKGREYPEYLITRDGFTFLAMGFTGAKAAEFKEKYIAALVIQSELYRPPKKER